MQRRASGSVHLVSLLRACCGASKSVKWRNKMYQYGVDGVFRLFRLHWQKVRTGISTMKHDFPFYQYTRLRRWREQFEASRSTSVIMRNFPKHELQLSFHFVDIIIYQFSNHRITSSARNPPPQLSQHQHQPPPRNPRHCLSENAGRSASPMAS